MDFFSAMDVAASGLSAERTRMNVTARNIANAQTTRTAEGGPYRRQDPVFTAVPLREEAGGFEKTLAHELQHGDVAGVAVERIVEDPSPPHLVYDPGHPDADARGYVAMPNVSLVEEMVNMITASRAYESGVTALQTLRSMAERAIGIGR